MSGGMVTIYALVCPIAREVRYVGRSLHPDRRRRQHLTRRASASVRRWATALASRGHAPRIIHLAFVDEKEADKTEKLWTAYFIGRVKLLLNRHNNTGKVPSDDMIRVSFGETSSFEYAKYYWDDDGEE